MKNIYSLFISIITILLIISKISNTQNNQIEKQQTNQEPLNQLKFLIEKYVNKTKIKNLSKPAEHGCFLTGLFYGRGVGRPINSCNPELEQNGLLCYPKCRENYTGVGPVCWQNCINGFRDDGAFCFKGSPYGRGAGYTLSNKDKCERENHTTCERWGLLYYPKCREGYRNIACCICSPECPPGMTDIGISCAKDSYGRGAGKPLGCGDNEDYDAGLCYDKCSRGYEGIGPVCWSACPKGYNKCGGLICLKDGEASCSEEIKDITNAILNIVGDFKQKNYIHGLFEVLEFLKDFLYPFC